LHQRHKISALLDLAPTGIHLCKWMNYVCQALHPQRKGFIYSFSSSFHEKACITFTKKRVHLFSFILVSWESVHYICKETGSSFHFHPHFMRKHALHAQRNNTFFIFILISWESVHYIHKKTGSSFHFHPHFMRKRALHPQKNRFIFSFSSSFHEKACITCTKKQVHLFILISWESVHYVQKKKRIYLFIFTFISRKNSHYMGENAFHGELCILFEAFSIFIIKLKLIHLILIFLLVCCCGNSWLYVFSWMYLKHNYFLSCYWVLEFRKIIVLTFA
jgi:hypothetical protein